MALLGRSFPRPSGPLRSWSDLIKGLGLFRPRLPAQLDDLADTVSQVEFDRNLIALGKLLLRQDIGICHGECPGLTLLRPECEGVLGLIDAYDCAS